GGRTLSCAGDHRLSSSGRRGRRRRGSRLGRSRCLRRSRGSLLRGRLARRRLLCCTLLSGELPAKLRPLLLRPELLVTEFDHLLEIGHLRIRLGDLLQKFVARANQTVLDLVDAARVSARPKAATEYGLRKLDVIFRAAKLPPKFLEVLRERTLNGLGRTHGSPDHMDENCL